MGKYTFTLLFYMSLSLYRIRRVTGLRALFVVFGSIYAIYSIIWDLAMDWSLCNPYSKNKFLRDSLAFRRKWVYYAAMVADVILRCTWIFYAIFSHDFQHSGLLSFFVSFAEVMRRGLWVIFRVENEHCTNVELFRASRDIPLPYHIPPTETSTPEPEEQRRQQQTQEGFRRTSEQFPQFATLDQQGEIRDRPATAEERPPMPPSGLGPDLERDLARFKRGQQSSISRMGTMLARAHTQDFERRTPAAETPSGHMGHNDDMSSSEEEEEEEGTVSNGSRNGTDHGSNEGSSSNSLLQRRHRRGSRDGESTHTQDDTESQSSQPSPKTRARQKGYDDDTSRR
ncbi:hypothetical protein KEM55_007431 [Ascosphaera atra]|nr:hypothetical protein KEM55_007431 [Ascosphaera atra]